MQDEALKEHFPRKPLVPGSLVLEAMLQTTGFIVVRTSGYKVLEDRLRFGKPPLGSEPHRIVDGGLMEFVDARIETAITSEARAYRRGVR